MQNVFDRSQYPAREPRTAVAKDRWAWKRTDIASVYPPASYELSYRFTSQLDTTDVQEAFAVEVDGNYVIEMESFDTELFKSGTYAWEAVILNASGSEAVVDRGFIEVSAAATASHTLKVLQAIRATIEGTATEDQSRIEIAGRVLERRSIQELTELEARYSARWAAEKASARGESSSSGSRIVKARFV